MTPIHAHARSIRELLDGARYHIDFYQRDYAWQERQARELVDDLATRFLDSHQPQHQRHQVAQYGHYFLGSIVISHKEGKRFVVDGQQRLTTLTLLLILLYRTGLEQGLSEAEDLKPLICATRFGKREFNLFVPDRTEAMEALLAGETLPLEGRSASVRNLVERYETLADAFPESLGGSTLPYFIDWLREHVHLVQIEAWSEDDAYMIFETMNDRGLSLSLPDMLKGYILSNIPDEGDQRIVHERWVELLRLLRATGDEADVAFFKDWLRARYAETIRPGGKGAESKDYERIGTEFHRWIRDNRTRMGLADAPAWQQFVLQEMDFLARQSAAIRQACHTIQQGWESLYYIEERGFTLHTQVVLAPLSLRDPPEITRRKVALVADYLDIWLARRVWNFRTIDYSSVRYAMFLLTRRIRGMSLEDLSRHLRHELDQQPESFAGQPRLRLHQQNYRQIRHILARLTHWVEDRCGLASHFADLVSKGRARPFEIEHVWANHHHRFADRFPVEADFENERNRLGGLLLLQRGVNQSLGDGTYEIKRQAYVTKGEKLLARSLHPDAYVNNPGFQRLLAQTGLPFRPYESFGPEEMDERQELYIRIAEWVWNPSRLDLDGEKPPVHEPILEEEATTGLGDQSRHEMRLRFWQFLLPRAHDASDLHKQVEPAGYRWVGVRRHGQWWNYVVLQDTTRVELFLDRPDKSENKALFDALEEERGAVEETFGAALDWQRLEDKRCCRVSFSVPGGWSEEAIWEEAARSAIEAMGRLYGALAPRIVEHAGMEEDESAGSLSGSERSLHYQAFWTAMLERAKGRNHRHASRASSRDPWLEASAGVPGVVWVYVVRRHDARVELYFKRSPEENERLFDMVAARKDVVEARFGAPLVWDRLDGRKACRISAPVTAGGYRDPVERWPDIHDALVDTMLRFEEALGPTLDEVLRGFEFR